MALTLAKGSDWELFGSEDGPLRDQPVYFRKLTVDPTSGTRIESTVDIPWSALEAIAAICAKTSVSACESGSTKLTCRERHGPRPDRWCRACLLRTGREYMKLVAEIQ